MDGSVRGEYDNALMNAVSGAVSIPVIASSGAGNEGHFVDVFEKTGVRAALAAGMFHRREVEIGSVKRRMEERGIRARRGYVRGEYKGLGDCFGEGSSGAKGVPGSLYTQCTSGPRLGARMPLAATRGARTLR